MQQSFVTLTRVHSLFESMCLYAEYVQRQICVSEVGLPVAAFRLREQLDEMAIATGIPIPTPVVHWLEAREFYAVMDDLHEKATLASAVLMIDDDYTPEQLSDMFSQLIRLAEEAIIATKIDFIPAFHSAAIMQHECVN